MSLPPILRDRLRLPAVGSPLFIISNPDLVIAQCKAGIVGSFPALNARPKELLEQWLQRITSELAEYDRAHPDAPSAPFAVNQIVHRSNDRLEHDLALCAKYKVPIVITSLGARVELNDAVHGWGGITLHDVIDDRFARKAIEKGADGLIAVAAGAGGHAGVQSPIALIQDIREWFDGPLLLSGAIASDGSGSRLHRLGVHRDEGGQRGAGLQADDRREQCAGHRLHESLHRRARQLSEALDPQRRPGSGPPSRERPQQDELRFRPREAQGVEGDLGLWAGHRGSQGSARRGRAGRAPEARVRAGARAALRPTRARFSRAQRPLRPPRPPSRRHRSSRP
jgi:hypothetical protein